MKKREYNFKIQVSYSNKISSLNQLISNHNGQIDPTQRQIFSPIMDRVTTKFKFRPFVRSNIYIYIYIKV